MPNESRFLIGRFDRSKSGAIKPVLLAVVSSVASSALTWYFIKFNPATVAAQMEAANASAAPVPASALSSRANEVPDSPLPVPTDPVRPPAQEVTVSTPQPSAPILEPAAPFDQAAFFSGQGPASKQDLANAALSLIQSVGQDETYIGPGVHPALYRDLQILQTMSNAVLRDDGSDPTATANWHNGFSTALLEAISQTTHLPEGGGESPESLQKTQQLRMLLQVINSRQPPP
ncbi:MAG TPA: hypothetical protein VG838_08465 [Opitutaceae bacterium]|nr:hypothetical protein [Opitutaceae bacterium]